MKGQKDVKDGYVKVRVGDGDGFTDFADVHRDTLSKWRHSILAGTKMIKQ